MGKIRVQEFCNQDTFNVSRDIARSILALENKIVELLALIESTGDRGHFEALKNKWAISADLCLC